MLRTFDIDAVLKATALNKDLVGCPIDEWLNNDKNIALVNDLGDVSLLEWRRNGLYMGHYFYFSRGKDALRVGKEFLHEAFTKHPVRIIIGTTPIDKKGALWLTRQLQFRHVEDIDIDNKLHRIWIMTKKDYECLV